VAAPLSDWHSCTVLPALPHVIISPQMLLMKFMSVGMFLLWNIRIFYTIGFFGCMLLARRLRLSLFVGCLWLLLFNFNGYVTSHLGIGHVEWFGYFLLPWFVYYAMDLAEGRPSELPALAIGMINLILLLQGAFHFVIWFMMFLGFMWLFRPSRRLARAICVIIVTTAFLGAIRIYPTMIVMGGDQQIYVPGYPSVSTFFDAMTVIHTNLFPPIKVSMAEYPVFWWEYDIYVSEIGMAFLFFFGVWPFFSPKAALRARPRFADFGWPAACMFALSFGHLFYWMFYLPRVPILGVAERSPSRFIAMPLCYVMLFACQNFQRLLDRKALAMSFASVVAIFAGFFGLAIQLFGHAEIWSVYTIDHSLPVPNYKPIHPIGSADPFIMNVINTAALASAVSVVVWVGVVAWLIVKERRRAKLAA
jgi:hypothetical protein